MMEPGAELSDAPAILIGRPAYGQVIATIPTGVASSEAEIKIA